MQKISPMLWFDGNAEDAANFYASVFKNSKIKQISRYPEGSPGPAGQVMVVSMEIEGQKFDLLNGGPQFKFTEAVSFVIDCKDQEEVDYYWNKLTTDGGKESQCGWLWDKFGLSWQVTPRILTELMYSPDPKKAQRTMEAMLKMKKIIIADLQKAHDGQ